MKTQGYFFLYSYNLESFDFFVIIWRVVDSVKKKKWVVIFARMTVPRGMSY